MRRILTLAVLVMAVTGVAAGLEVPPVPSQHVTDLAGILGGRAGELSERFRAIEQRTGHQVIVVTFPSLDGEALEDFTMRCAERWKVGRKGLDDGAIFFVFAKDRRMRLEVGYGLEGIMPDAVAKRVQSGMVKPAFARGDYAAGVAGLADGLDMLFRGEPLPTPPARKTSRGGASPLGLLGLIAAVLILRALFGRRSWASSLAGRGPWIGGPGGWSGGSGGSSGGGFGGFSSGGGSFGGGGSSDSW